VNGDGTQDLPRLHRIWTVRHNKLRLESKGNAGNPEAYPGDGGEKMAVNNRIRTYLKPCVDMSVSSNPGHQIRAK